MEKNTILKTPLLDIIFDGRNKEYGAYELRSQYNSRLTKAMAVTLGLGVLIMLSSFLKVKNGSGVVRAPKIDSVELTKVAPEEPLPVIPPPKQIQPPVATTSFTNPPLIEKDELVTPDEMPPEIDQLTNTKIGVESNPGEDFTGIIAPPLEIGGVVEAPKAKREDSVYLKVEIDAEFPGGNAGWTKYVTREIERNIDELQDDGRSGSVVVYFIVDTEGNVSDVKSLPCAESGVANCLGAGAKLSEVAVSAIRKGPRWKPAIQSGRQVKAYRRQVVTFQLSEE